MKKKIWIIFLVVIISAQSYYRVNAADFFDSFTEEDSPEVTEENLETQPELSEKKIGDEKTSQTEETEICEEDIFADSDETPEKVSEENEEFSDGENDITLFSSQENNISTILNMENETLFDCAESKNGHIWELEAGTNNCYKCHFCGIEKILINGTGDEKAMGICGKHCYWSVNKDGVLRFWGTGDMYIYGTPNSSKTYSLGNMGLGIAPWMKYWSKEINSIKVENGITSISDGAFACVDLDSSSPFAYKKQFVNISLPDTIRSIGYEAFWGVCCEKLIIPQNVGTWSEDFLTVADIDTVFFEDGIQKIHKIGQNTVKNFILPSSVNSLSEGAFSNCYSLESIKLPYGITEIPESAFSNCTKLKSITIPSSVTKIGSSAFSSCKSLTAITIPSGVTTLSFATFERCENLERITLPESVTLLENFNVLCDKLTDIYYEGNEASWNKITIYNPEYLSNVKIHYAKAGSKPIETIEVKELKIGGRTSDALRLNWNKSITATGYIIEQQVYNKIGPVWRRIKKIEGNTTVTFRVENLDASTEYAFRIKGYIWDKTTKQTIYSKYVYIRGETTPEKVGELKIGGCSFNALRLNWKQNNSAQGYIVEQKKNGIWVQLKKLERNTITTLRVEKLNASEKYEFRVKAYNWVGFEKQTFYGEYAYISGKTIPSNINDLRISGCTSDAIRLSWNKNTSASGYIIEQQKNGVWARIKKIEGNTITTLRVERLSASTKYDFRIKAYNWDSRTKQSVCGGYSYISGKTMLNKVSGLKISGSTSDAIRLSWNKNTSASGCIIEQQKNGVWVRIKEIDGNTITTLRVEKLKANTTHNFRIRAYNWDRITGQTFYSEYTYISGKTR